MKKNTTQETELFRPLAVDKIPAGGVEEDIIANKTERAALAARFGLLDLPVLEAHLDIDHTEGRMIKVTGSFRAEVVQQCVVTLEPVAASIEETIDVIYAPEAVLDVGANPPHGDVFEDEIPEPIINGIIDLGELVAQHLAVAINPYPRKPGAEMPVFASQAMTSNPGADNPFVKLAEMKEKTPEKDR